MEIRSRSALGITESEILLCLQWRLPGDKLYFPHILIRGSGGAFECIVKWARGWGAWGEGAAKESDTEVIAK